MSLAMAASGECLKSFDRYQSCQSAPLVSDFGLKRQGRKLVSQGLSMALWPDDDAVAVAPIAGLQVADTCFYYPEDRDISESMRLTLCAF